MEKNLKRFIRTKNAKRLFMSILAMLMTFSNLGFVRAASDREILRNLNVGFWEVKTDDEGKMYLGNDVLSEKISQVYRRDENGQLVPVDLAEHARFLNFVTSQLNNQLNSFNQSLPFPMAEPLTFEPGDFRAENSGSEMTTLSSMLPPVIFDTFRETYSYVGVGNQIIMTPYMRGPGRIWVSQSRNVEHSFGGGVSLTTQIKNAIEVGSSFSWNETVATGTSLGMKWEIESEHTGYITFTPFLDISIGDVWRNTAYGLNIHNAYLGSAWGGCPKTNGLYADGIWQLVYR